MPSLAKFVAVLGATAGGVESAKLLSPSKGQQIDNSYIVVLKSDTTETKLNDHQNWLSSSLQINAISARLTFANMTSKIRTYDVGSFKGYSGLFDRSVVDDILLRHEVDYVEHNILITCDSIVIHPDVDTKEKTLCGKYPTGPPIGIPTVMSAGLPADLPTILTAIPDRPDPGLPRLAPPFHKKDECSGLKTVKAQKNASWALSSISSPEQRTDQPYLYDESAGAGTTVYVIDSGIHTKHPEFEGRATEGYNSVSEYAGDQFGHGTHVAGIIGSKTYGVAKRANLVAVKVLNEYGGGSAESVMDGLRWAVKRAREADATKKSVINMSIGGSDLGSRSIREMLNTASNSGLHVVCAAGNDDTTVRGWPALHKNALTVGAHQMGGNISDYSNYGRKVDIYAPGDNVTSTFIGKNGNETAEESGTSMASPHVAGYVAYLISKEGECSTEEMNRKVIGRAANGTSEEHGKYRILYNGIQGRFVEEQARAWTKKICTIMPSLNTTRWPRSRVQRETRLPA